MNGSLCVHDDPSEWAHRRERAETVRRARNRVRPVYRVFLILRDENDWPLDLVARAFGLSHDQAKHRVVRARAELLRKLLEVGIHGTT